MAMQDPALAPVVREFVATA